MPPLQSNTTNGEKQLRHITEGIITKVAQEHAEAFLNGPARYLMEITDKAAKKLRKIYNDAAIQSYMLWTRRTEMRVYTLRDMPQPCFDAESPDFDPDALMRPENHDGHLKGKPITVLVHPLLEVAGTDAATDYDKSRVWAKGIVWVDST
jgi:hypothetical protein